MSNEIPQTIIDRFGVNTAMAKSTSFDLSETKPGHLVMLYRRGQLTQAVVRVTYTTATKIVVKRGPSYLEFTRKTGMLRPASKAKGTRITRIGPDRLLRYLAQGIRTPLEVLESSESPEVVGTPEVRFHAKGGQAYARVVDTHTGMALGVPVQLDTTTDRTYGKSAFEKEVSGFLFAAEIVAQDKFRAMMEQAEVDWELCQAWPALMDAVRKSRD